MQRSLILHSLSRRPSQFIASSYAVRRSATALYPGGCVRTMVLQFRDCSSAKPLTAVTQPEPLENSPISVGESVVKEGNVSVKAEATEEIKAPGRMAKLFAAFKGMTLKQIIKQYGIPIAIFYWFFNEALVAIVTYLLHYNYISQNGVVDFIDAIGFGSWIDTQILNTHNIQLGPLNISALLLTNFLVASAFLALFVPVKLPFCIWLYPKVRDSFRRVFPKRVKKDVAPVAVPDAAVTSKTVS